MSSPSVNPSLLRLRRQARAGCEAEPKLPRDRLAETALREVVAHRQAGVSLPQVSLEVRGRLVEQLEQALAALASRLRPG